MTSDGAADTFSVKGIGMSTYGVGGYDDSTVDAYAASAVAGGANTVALGTVAYVDLSTNIIGNAYSGAYNQTAPLAEVDNAIQTAEAHGLSVFLKPQLVTSDPSYSQYTSGNWINLVNPDLTISNPAAFFAAYKSYILSWAELAQKDHVSALSIGNEMVAATKPEYTAYWDDIISSVRQVYQGQLTYSALLPVLASSSSNEVSQIQFWSKLDFAGFDVYPSLASKSDPSVAELNAAWHSQSVYGQTQDYYSFVTQMADLVGKPVVFTETGLPSFQGAADRETSSDGNIGSPTSSNSVAPTDYSEQANWWESFFSTWMQNKPIWLQGAVVWNNDPEDLGSSYANSYNIIGKPAQGVVASWYGGSTDLAAMSDHLTGSQGNDRLYAYGHSGSPASSGGSAMAATQSTTVSVSLTAPIISGQSPSFDLVVNGVDVGHFDVKPTDSGYVTAQGDHFTTNQTYSVSLAGLQSLDSIKIVWDGDTQVGGHATSLYLNGVTVNGVALSAVTYTAASGYVQQQQFGNGTSSLWDGGSSSVDTSAWNTALSGSHVGSAADPIVVTGGGGNDVLNVLGSQADYSVTLVNATTIALAENHGLGQNLVASGIGEIDFADGSSLTVNANGQIALSGSGAQQVMGSSGDDVITAAGATGATVIQGGAGSDTITSGSGNAHIYGNSNTSVQGAQDGADTITVGAGSNYINGNGGDDIITVGTGGSTGVNRISGGMGNDTITIHGAGFNSANGNTGNDRIDASDATGNNLLRGGQGDDVVRAGHGQDRLYGDVGNDTLVAGTGSNHLTVMTGGSGADTFDFSGGAATTMISQGASFYQEVTDFTTGTDHIGLSFSVTSSDLVAGDHTFDTVSSAQAYAQDVLSTLGDHLGVIATQVGSDTMLFYDASGTSAAIDSVVKLDNVTATSLSAGDFVAIRS